jgi:hypothetical protein
MGISVGLDLTHEHSSRIINFPEIVSPRKTHFVFITFFCNMLFGRKRVGQMERQILVITNARTCRHTHTHTNKQMVPVRMGKHLGK